MPWNVSADLCMSWTWWHAFFQGWYPRAAKWPPEAPNGSCSISLSRLAPWHLCSEEHSSAIYWPCSRSPSHVCTGATRVTGHTGFRGWPHVNHYWCPMPLAAKGSTHSWHFLKMCSRSLCLTWMIPQTLPHCQWHARRHMDCAPIL